MIMPREELEFRARVSLRALDVEGDLERLRAENKDLRAERDALQKSIDQECEDCGLWKQNEARGQEIERLRGALQDGVDDLASYADKKGAVKFAIEDVVFYMRTALAGKEKDRAE